MSIVETRSKTRKAAGQTGQRITYAATVTPNPNSGGSRKLITLTGPITIANPPAASQKLGAMLSFLFTQDATGGRVVTWGSDYPVSWTPTTTTGKRNSIDFVWDGTKWAQVGQMVGV
jgi:hypothetical protein